MGIDMAKRSTTIRIDGPLHRRALTRLRQLGFKTFSEYVETLCRVDQDQELRFTLVRDKKGPHWSAEIAEPPVRDSSTIPTKKPKGLSSGPAPLRR